MSTKDKLSIIILTAAPDSTATNSIIKAGEDRGHTMYTFDPANLYLLISDKVKGYDRIYEASPDHHTPDRINAYECDAVISRIGSNLEYGSAVLEHVNRNLGIFCTQSAEGIKTAANKLISLQKLSQNKVRVPKTVIGDNILHVRWLINQVGGLPAIGKTLKGSQGIGIYPLINELQTNAMLESFYKQKTNLIIQEFIDAGSRDIRVIVIDQKVIVAMEREARPGELRSNISLGGSGKKVYLSEEDEQLCIKAAESVGLSGAAGVDLIKSKEGDSYIIEVNSNYGYKVEEITNTDISTPLIEFCERNYKKGSIATPNISAMSDREFNYYMLATLYAGMELEKKPSRYKEKFMRNVRFNLNDIGLTENELRKDAKEIFKKIT